MHFEKVKNKNFEVRLIAQGCNLITNTPIVTHYTVDRADAGSIVTDIGIGYRPCQFLDIGYRKFQKLAYRSDTSLYTVNK